MCQKAGSSKPSATFTLGALNVGRRVDAKCRPSGAGDEICVRSGCGAARVPGRSLAAVAHGDDPLPGELADVVPAIPASAGALIFDHPGRLLILKPTYKSRGPIPGGCM